MLWQPQKRKALWDADSLLYACAIATEGNKGIACLKAVRECILDIRELLQLDECKFLLSGPGNFRYTIYPEYKANRRASVKPQHLVLSRDYLVRYWGAEVSNGCEADDLMSDYWEEDILLIHIDKDINQIPGWHFNPKKNSLYSISSDEAAYIFWKSVLTGDSTDNIKGIPKIGPKKADKILKGQIDYKEVVYNKYIECNLSPEYFDQQYRLLKLGTKN